MGTYALGGCSVQWRAARVSGGERSCRGRAVARVGERRAYREADENYEAKRRRSSPMTDRSNDEHDDAHDCRQRGAA